MVATANGRALQPLTSLLGTSTSVRAVRARTVPTMSTDLHIFDRIWTEAGEGAIVYGSVHDPIPDLNEDASREDRSGGSGASSSGQIRRCMEDTIDGVPVADELRRVLLDEDSEHYDIFPPAIRSDLLFLLLRHVAIGGGLNQYETSIHPYLAAVKSLARDLLTIRTNPNTNQPSIASTVLKIEGLETVTQSNAAATSTSSSFVSLFPSRPRDKFHLCLLAIDPNKKHITTYYFSHTSAW